MPYNTGFNTQTGTYAYREKIKQCPCCNRKHKCAVIRKHGYKYPILNCMHIDCELHSSKGVALRREMGKEYALNNDKLHMIGEDNFESMDWKDPLQVSGYAAHLARTAHHCTHLQRASLKRLRKWMFSYVKHTSDTFEAAFFAEYLLAKKPSYSQEAMFSAAVSDWKAGLHEELGKDVSLVACIYRAMALFGGQDLDVSVSGREAEKHLRELGVELPNHRFYRARRTIIDIGLIVESDDNGYFFSKHTPSKNKCQKFKWGPALWDAFKQHASELLQSLQDQYRNSPNFIRLMSCVTYRRVQRETRGQRVSSSSVSTAERLTKAAKNLVGSVGKTFFPSKPVAKTLTPSARCSYYELGY